MAKSLSGPRDSRGRLLRKKNGQFKKSPVRSRSKSSSRRRSQSMRRRKTRLSGPRDSRGNLLRKRNGQFKKSPSRTRRNTRSRSTSRRSRSTKSRSTSSRGRWTAKDTQKLRRLLGLRKSDQLSDYINVSQKATILRDLEARERRRRAARQRSQTSRGSVRGGRQSASYSRRSRSVDGRFIIPSLKEVVDHYALKAAEGVYCPKEECKTMLRDLVMIKETGVYPKSVADLRFIFENLPTERKARYARCWICVFRSYREVYKNLNGVYPGADVPDNFADLDATESETFEGPMTQRQSENATRVDETPSPAFAAMNPNAGNYRATGELTPAGRKRWTLAQ